ncbi:MAG: alpha/beta hydrolase [Actinomycetes bacterium]
MTSWFPGRCGALPWSAVSRGLAGLLVLGLAVAGCTESGGGDASPSVPADSGSAAPTTRPAGLKQYYAQTLDWRGCAGEFQCADLRVPVDYAEPDGDSITIAVTRLRAGDRDDRIGSLLLNPGGPGGSGIEYAQAADRVVNAPLRERFDIVGFDPRGVAESSPVDCLDDAGLDKFIAVDGTPDDGTERAALVRAAKSFVQGCRERSGDLLAHVSTVDAARDLDVLRAVLGDKKLSYLGKSYGTQLGATYAELFPTRVRVAVLDGAIDPSLPSDEVTSAQAEGFDRALRAFVTDCLARDRCPLSGSVDDATAQVSALLDRIDTTPLSGADRQVTQSMAVIGMAAALYDEANGWPALRTAIERAKDGDGSVLLLLADFYTDRAQDGSYRNNQNEVIYAVNCLDRPQGQEVTDYEADAKAFAEVAPVFGPYLAWSSLPCAYWPVAPQDRPHEIRAPGSPPLLVVGTRRDPATPYEWAESLASQLDAGVLLTYDGDGHTAYARGSACIDEKVERYLIRGEPPAAGTVCQ